MWRRETLAMSAEMFPVLTMWTAFNSLERQGSPKSGWLAEVNQEQSGLPVSSLPKGVAAVLARLLSVLISMQEAD